MLRGSARFLSIFSAARLTQPPTHGYELSELPGEHVLQEFLDVHREGIVHVIVGNGADCPLTNKVTSVLHHTPLGNPKDVKLALLQAGTAERLVKEQGILALPTTLIYFRGKLMDRVVGTRVRELMVKSRFILRNHELSPYSV
jgi:hypothetical protein